ncbi:MAG: GWxTD domain-containing protein [Bacteroidota bacterium]
MKIILIISFIISYVAWGQVEYSHGILSIGDQPGFFLDAASYKSDTPDKTRLDVFIQVPYKNLQFIKKRGELVARYSVTLSFYDEDKDDLLFEKVWNSKIIASNFDAASSEKNFKFDYKSFDLAPEKYVLRCNIYDKDSKKDYTVEATVSLQNYDQRTQVSDLVFIKSEIDSQIIPNISKTYTTQDSVLHFFYEIYSEKNQTLNLKYEIESADEDIVYSKSTQQDVLAGSNIIKYKLDDSNFSLGKYTLTVKTVDKDGDVVSSSSKTFVSRIYGFPISINDLDEAIKQMIHFSGKTVRDNLLDIEDHEEKLQEFKNYWKSKDPSPNTIENEVLNEYYRRVGYANKHFKHYYEGWKTDMGMVYIVLGPPNNVERHPFEYDSKPYEIWYYYSINERFYFVDDTGFGDYRLLNFSYGDWYRYRQ